MSKNHEAADDSRDFRNDCLRCENAAWGYVSTGESRWPASVSVGGALVLQLLLPDRLTIGPFWLIPAIEAFVLVTLIIVAPSHVNNRTRDARWLALGLIAILILTNAITLGLLMHHLLHAGPDLNGRSLVFSAVAVWSTGVVAFGLSYWEIDRGGPTQRCSPLHPAPDFMFPQMENPDVTEERWTPRFTDYLYVSLTNSTAFSPTDALPLTARAKAIMAVQSLTSLATIVVVGARAVNILK